MFGERHSAHVRNDDDFLFGLRFCSASYQCKIYDFQTQFAAFTLVG